MPLLTQEQIHKILDWYDKQEPYVALKYVSTILTPERLAWCKAQINP